MPESSTRAVDRALDLLSVISDKGRLGLADAARETDIPVSTALRLLRTLEVKDFLFRGEDGLFRPGTRLMQLGARAFSHDVLVDLAHPHMKSLAAESGESVYLSVEGHGDTILYISIVEGTHSVRHANWVGRTIPTNKSAAGEVLLGRTPPCGYVIRFSGVEEDVAGISAPIQQGNRIIAAMSMLVPLYRIDEASAHRAGTHLSRVARSVSESMGSRFSTPGG